MWVQQPSEPNLFIYFPIFLPTFSTEAHYEIMEKPFSIQRQLVATGYKGFICPQGDFADQTHYRREGLKKRGWGRQVGPSPPSFHPPLLQRWNSPRCVRMPPLRPKCLTWAWHGIWTCLKQGCLGKMGKEVAYEVPREVFQMMRWLKRTQHVGKMGSSSFETGYLFFSLFLFLLPSQYCYFKIIANQSWKLVYFLFDIESLPHPPRNCLNS